MKIVIQDARLFRMDLRTRMPFRYGIATVTALPHVFLRLGITVDGEPAVGMAADHLAPKWFTKNPETSPEYDIAEMERVIRHAMECAVGAEGETVFALWQQLYDAQAEWGGSENLPSLLTHFGVSLVERALIDAVCRHAAQPFAKLLHDNQLGIHLEKLYPELANAAPKDFLPSKPLPQVTARHTVGLADPLTDADIASEDRLQDGLPQSLEESIRVYGLRHFKLKVGGNAAADAERIAQVLETIARNCPPDWKYTLDGNESYTSLESFREFWEMLTRSASGSVATAHLLFIEQPFHRSLALADAIGEALTSWQDHPPIIIDESDGAIGDFPRALSLGYGGTSHKNCKGVFKGIANTCLARKRGAFISGEDLSNVGPVALPQDLAVQAALGIESVERNGQHYFAGLRMFPEAVQAVSLRDHADLYHRLPEGYVVPRIENGQIALDSVNAAPFGVRTLPEVSSFAEVASVS
ncbi:MAG: mandelate racemase [Armatimonadaceae bacterium]